MKAQMKAQVKIHKLRNTFFLFLTAMIWGAAFVAQSVSMDYIGPFTIYLPALCNRWFVFDPGYYST